ncbi:MAG: 3-isopropylmalate dehydratase large subunit [Nitrosomonadaceae bacterium]|nr:3-isopropylmalate dehydratase large subunit [Nitrosomonadaceae bacterium]
MPHTISQKIIARAAGEASVSVGQIVTCKVDLAMMHDSGGPRRVESKLKELGVGIWDPSKVVLVADHYTPAVDADSAGILSLTRKFATLHKIHNFYDGEGICHVILPERGHMKPGLFAVGGDSHSPSGGAYGAFMVGMGATEMAGVLATGEIWVRVPATIRVEWNGALSRGVVAKDILLKLCATLGMNNDYKVIEYAGSTVAAMWMNERLTLSNMAAELGAKTGIIAPDATTAADLKAKGVQLEPWRAALCSDDDALYEAVHQFDTAALVPHVAAPHSPANSHPVTDTEARHIDQAYLGACTGAKENDLRMAAEVLKGRKVAKGTRLFIAPASTQTTAKLAADGTLAVLLEAGAQMMPTGCGACAGYGAGLLADGEVSIASTARNFKGRMGSSKAEVYLGSPYTVAASAVKGHIADPREFLL